ncbi:MAG: DNA starvation/stationary phase protection protein [Ginsengibacter sp.]
MNYPAASWRGIEYKIQLTHKNTNSHPAASCEEFFRLKINKMESSLLGIKSGNLSSVAHMLNILLADEFLLYTKTRNAHWNVEGPDFYSKHKFFETQYGQLEQICDDVAERIRALDHYAIASLQAFLKVTHLTEESREHNDSTGFIHELLEDHESVIIFIRENINRFSDKLHDAGTTDFITGILETHEKMAWMLRAQLK